MDLFCSWRPRVYFFSLFSLPVAGLSVCSLSLAIKIKWIEREIEGDTYRIKIKSKTTNKQTDEATNTLVPLLAILSLSDDERERSFQFHLAEETFFFIAARRRIVLSI